MLKVETDFYNRNRNYIINISKKNFEHMCQGYPEIDCLVGRAKDACEFYIFQNPLGEVSKSFKLMPDGNGYYIYFGVKPPELKYKFTRKDFDIAAKQHYDNLENRIKTIGQIPITIEGATTELTLGYVTLKLEEE